MPTTFKTNQAAFNAVVRHLGTMKKRAIQDYGSACQYLTPDGRSCAIGGVLPKRVVEKHEDQLRASTTTVRGILEDPYGGGLHEAFRTVFHRDIDIELLATLQGIHDNEYNWGSRGFNRYGVKELRRVASTYGLSVKVVNSVFGGAR